MRARTLVVLAIVTLLVIVAAVVATRNRSPLPAASSPLLFSELASRINDIARITINGQERQITLLRRGDAWFISEEDDYPAKLDRIREVAIGASELRLLAERTSNPELFSRLGVEDPESPGAGSTWLELQDTGGDTLAKLVVGKPRHSANRGDVPGLYVRVPGREPALLVAGNLDISTVAVDWFDRNLANIGAERIRSIEIRHGDDETLTLSRDNAGADLALQQVPAGREAQSAVILGRMTTILENFFINGARKTATVDWPAAATEVTVRTFDGLVASIAAAQVADAPMATLAFSFDAAAAAPTETAAQAETTAAEGTADVAAEAKTLNEATGGWVFRIPQFKFELLTRTHNDLTRAAGGDQPDAPPATTLP